MFTQIQSALSCSFWEDGIGKTERRVRDTEVFFTVRCGQSKNLKYLSERFLKENIQTGRHSSIEDARAPVRLYLMFR
jgi:hypothetical protein